MILKFLESNENSFMRSVFIDAEWMVQIDIGRNIKLYYISIITEACQKTKMVIGNMK